jgi:hypothetical protein
METLKTEKQVAAKVAYERPTLEKRERLSEVAEGGAPRTLSGISG